MGGEKQAKICHATKTYFDQMQLKILLNFVLIIFRLKLLWSLCVNGSSKKVRNLLRIVRIRLIFNFVVYLISLFNLADHG